MSFRDAYIQVGNNLDKVETPNHVQTVKERTHKGSTGNLGLEDLAEHIQQTAKTWKTKQADLQKTWSILRGNPPEMSNPKKKLPVPKPA